MHCVFHGIRFKVNEDWVSAIDTLLFFIHTLTFSFALMQKKSNKRKNEAGDFWSGCVHLASLRLFRHVVEVRKENRLYFR